MSAPAVPPTPAALPTPAAVPPTPAAVTPTPAVPPTVPKPPKLTQRPRLSYQQPTVPNTPSPSPSPVKQMRNSSSYSTSVLGQTIMSSILFAIAIIMAGLAIWFGTTALNQNGVQDTRISELNATDILLASEIDSVNASLVTVNSTLQSEIDLILSALNLTNGTYLVTINNVPGVANNINLTSQTSSTLTINSPGAGLIDLYVTAVTSVATGTGLSGGPITSTGTISLANTAVTPGSYTYAAITVDQQGRLTAASSGTSPVTSVATGTGLTGGPITSTGTISLANTAVTPGSYTLASITVDAQGRITAASSGSAGSGTVTNVATGTGLTGGPITTTGTIALADTAVTPGSYTYGAFTVDQQGRLTAASSGTSPVTSVATGTGLTGGPITSTGTISLADTAVTPGSYTYGSFTVDQQGRLTAASSGTSPVTSVATGTGLTGGPITSTGTISLANTAVTPGSYTLASITVDAQGRITAASSGSAGSGTVTNVATGTGLTGGPITTTGTIELANTAVTPGSYTYASITVDAQGRLTAASTGTAPVLTYASVPLLGSQTISGDPYTFSWDTAYYDPSGIRTSSSTFTIPSSGLWQFHIQVVVGFPASTFAYVDYWVNGVLQTVIAVNTGSLSQTNMASFAMLRLSASDTVQLKISGQGLSTNSISAPFGDVNVMTITKLSS